MEFTVNGHEYATKKLSAFDQFHVARRVAPVVAALSGGMEKNDAEGIFASLAGMKDEDVDWVLNKLLEGAERKNAGCWSPVRKNGVTMFDLDLKELLSVCYQVFQANFENFIDGLPSLSALEGMAKG